jgi:hypothetical protein
MNIKSIKKEMERLLCVDESADKICTTRLEVARNTLLIHEDDALHSRVFSLRANRIRICAWNVLLRQQLKLAEAQRNTRPCTIAKERFAHNQGKETQMLPSVHALHVLKEIDSYGLVLCRCAGKLRRWSRKTARNHENHIPSGDISNDGRGWKGHRAGRGA